MKSINKTPPMITVTNCTFTRGAFVFNSEMVRVIEALARAAEANAVALKSMSDRLCGPIDNSSMLHFEPKQ